MSPQQQGITRKGTLVGGCFKDDAAPVGKNQIHVSVYDKHDVLGNINGALIE